MAADNLPSLRVILHRFSDARCVLNCAIRSLEARDDQSTDEQVCFQHGLELLNDIYNDFDRAIGPGGAL